MKSMLLVCDVKIKQSKILFKKKFILKVIFKLDNRKVNKNPNPGVLRIDIASIIINSIAKSRVIYCNREIIDF
jgi:hypothetical protein